MCLLITGRSNTFREVFLNTPGLIEDVYASNSDGMGVMYATKRGLKVVKQLPHNPDDVRKIVQALPNDDRDIAVHLRYKTHGDIDMANCHPYPVNGDAWLMHNGVLDTGNAADRSKSDTWHFVKDYLASLGTDALHDKGLLAMMADFIGNNRFAIMSGDGRLSVVNRDQGIEAAGLWLSNTYAWSPGLLIPGYRTATRYSFGGHLRANAWAYGLDDSPIGYESAFTQAYDEDADDYDTMAEAIEMALDDFDLETLHTVLELNGVDAIDYILRNFNIAPWHRFSPSTASELEATLVQAWVTGNATKLAGADAYDVAKTLLNSCDWSDKVVA